LRMSPSGEINCPGCNQVTLLLRSPKYDGFTRIGESCACSSCGYKFEEEKDVPFKDKEVIAVFSDEDRTVDSEVFEEGETQQLCRYCRHYVINPFTQWCGVHKKEVEATDTCKQFDEKKEDKEGEEKEKKPLF